MAGEKLNTDRLFDEAMKLFRVKGYHNTSMDDIAKACHIKKPSIYHHVASREELLIKAAARFRQQCKDHVLCCAHNSEVPAKQYLNHLTDNIKTFTVENNNRCVISKLTHELSGNIPEFTEIARGYFQDWEEAFFTLFQSKYTQEDARRFAIESLTKIQGSLILGELKQSFQPIEMSVNSIQALLD